MKQKFFFLCLCGCFLTPNAWAADIGFRYIKSRGEVLCGTDLDSETYAYKDEAGYWRGIGADLCRVFSIAIFGRSDKFRLVNVKENQVNSAIAHNKIDIMLGNAPGTASQDISGKTTQAELIYYTRQMFLAHKNNQATSMEDFKGKKICLLNKNYDFYNFRDFNNKYNLDLRPLFFNNQHSALEAFFLKRCDLFTGNELDLISIINHLKNANVQIEILPEVVAEKPIYAQVLKDNQKLRASVKWIINALALAEKQGINSKNIDVFIGIKDESLKNLLGFNPDVWNKFELNPDWVRIAIKELGNYGEIYERNLGELSEFKIKRDKNNLIENGGLIGAQSFF